jgi:GT2 family glycosyltransferase
MNKVYIIIVNHNNFADTIECLESLLKSEYLNYQIFVVDNSKDELSMNRFFFWTNHDNYDISTDFPDLILPLQKKPIGHQIFSEIEFESRSETFKEKLIFIKAKNNGFAAANNIVLKYILKNADATALIWILNNDTVVEKTTLGNLVYGYLDNLTEKCIFASKLRYYSNPSVIQAVAGSYNKWIGKHYHIGSGKLDTGQFDNYSFGKSDYAVGASIFLPVLFIEQTGLMCENYFLYFEELDWVISGLTHGFKTMLVPNAIVYHKEGVSIAGSSNEKPDTSIAEYYSIVNRVRFIKKWYPYCLVTVMPGVFWALTKRILQGKFKLVKKISSSLFQVLFSIKSPPLKYGNS